MDFDAYQDLALRTKNTDLDPKLSQAVTALGLAGEAGETADYIKKVVGHDHPLDRDHVAKEIGDVLWYCASLCDEYGLSMQEVAEWNIEKLKKRYPEGFSSTASIKRSDVR
jgi:NTP pyrophosphatase (non-canonical NTP hydrolase)